MHPISTPQPQHVIDFIAMISILGLSSACGFLLLYSSFGKIRLIFIISFAIIVTIQYLDHTIHQISNYFSILQMTNGLVFGMVQAGDLRGQEVHKTLVTTTLLMN